MLGGRSKGVCFPRKHQKLVWLDARLCTNPMGSQTFSFLSICLMYLVKKKHIHCQDSGLETASPMVILAENLVVFCIFFLTFYLIFYHGAQPQMFSTLSLSSWRLAICGMVLFCACSTQVLSFSITEMSNLSPYAQYMQDLEKFNSLQYTRGQIR